MSRLRTLLLVAATGCQGQSGEETQERTPTDAHCVTDEVGVFPDTSDPDVDYDCDGWGRTQDCDNRNSLVHPEAIEYNNGRDDDCVDGEGLYYGCIAPGQASFWPAVPALWLAARSRRRRP